MADSRVKYPDFVSVYGQLKYSRISSVSLLARPGDKYGKDVTLEWRRNNDICLLTAALFGYLRVERSGYRSAPCRINKSGVDPPPGGEKNSVETRKIVCVFSDQRVQNGALSNQIRAIIPVSRVTGLQLLAAKIKIYEEIRQVSVEQSLVVRCRVTGVVRTCAATDSSLIVHSIHQWPKTAILHVSA